MFVTVHCAHQAPGYGVTSIGWQTPGRVVGMGEGDYLCCIRYLALSRIWMHVDPNWIKGLIPSCSSTFLKNKYVYVSHANHQPQLITETSSICPCTIKLHNCQPEFPSVNNVVCSRIVRNDGVLVIWVDMGMPTSPTEIFFQIIPLFQTN